MHGRPVSHCHPLAAEPCVQTRVTLMLSPETGESAGLITGHCGSLLSGPCVQTGMIIMLSPETVESAELITGMTSVQFPETG